jgi:hypothetical protein
VLDAGSTGYPDVERVIPKTLPTSSTTAGNRGGRVIARGELAGKHHALRREIDHIFGTALSR